MFKTAVVVAAVLALAAGSGGFAQASSQALPDSDQSVVPLPGSADNLSDWDGVVARAGDRQGLSLDRSQVDSASEPLPGNSTRLHVKFDETMGLSSTPTGFDDGVKGSSLDAALALGGQLSVRPLFSRPAAELDRDRADAERVSGQPQPDLSTWFLITTRSAAAGQALETALRQVPGVEMVQPEPELALTAEHEEEALQGYLNASPAGLGVEWAWGQAGGTGSNVTVAVVDSGFDTDHPDLDRASAPGVSIAHVAPWDPFHGLQVLGILAADDDDQGMRGIAAGAGLRTVNSGRTSGEVANAINLAGAAVGAGDVITISQGICAVSGCADGVVLPLVYSSSARDALRLASAQGVITVVSAGNGGAQLGNYSSRLGSDAPDTIVVGAANPPPVAGCSDEDGPARSRTRSSNYGARVDLQGWGNCVRTTQQGGGYQWWRFTSAATPVVSGSAALLSSIVQERLGITLTGGQIRALFDETGSPQVTSGTRGGEIGPLPNIRAAADSLALIPANDMWASARSVEEAPFAAVFETRWAGVEVDEPAVLCGEIAHTAWYELSPQTDVEVTFDTEGSTVDTIVGLWRREGDGLRRISCDNDISTTNVQSRLTRTLRAGQTYYLQVGAAQGESGTIRTNVRGLGLIDVGCDVNNNGRGDVISGSPHEGISANKNAGRALVHFGRKSGRPKAVTSITQEFSGLSGSSERGDRLGTAVACGDFNADGYDDIAIGSPGEDIGSADGAGAVRIVAGSETGLTGAGASTFSQASRGVAGRAEDGDNFGAALAVGDFDGDGYDDLAIGVPGEGIGKKRNSGAVHVLYGSADGLTSDGSQLFHGGSPRLPNKAERGDAFGATLSAGDLDFDSYDDLVIGAPREDLGSKRNAGAVFLLPGSADGVTTSGSSVLHQGVAGVPGASEKGDRFGSTLAVGNVNGDDYEDVLIGVPNQDLEGAPDGGMVYMFAGSEDGADPATSVAFSQGLAEVSGTAQPGDLFGAALSVGDFDGDGFDDVAVGVPGQRINQASEAGLVQVFFGSGSGPVLGSSVSVSQAGKAVGGKPERKDHLGAALGSVDINGDGYQDLVIGVPDEDAGKIKNAGYILLVPGSPSGIDPASSSGLSQKRPRTGANERGDRFGYALGA